MGPQITSSQPPFGLCLITRPDFRAGVGRNGGLVAQSNYLSRSTATIRVLRYAQMSRTAYCGSVAEAARYRRMLLWIAVLGLSLSLVVTTVAASVATALAPARQK